MPLPLVSPVLPIRSQNVPIGREWVYELKLDGFRGTLYVENRRGWFASKTMRTMHRFQGLADALARSLPVRNAVLDGEIIVMGDAAPDFAALFYKRGLPQYVAFDMLWMNGRDLRPLSLTGRKRALLKLVDSTPIGYVPETKNPHLFKSVVAMDLEGIVAKRWRDPYGATTEWVKVKNREYSQAEGRHARHEMFKR